MIEPRGAGNRRRLLGRLLVYSGAAIVAGGAGWVNPEASAPLPPPLPAPTQPTTSATLPPALAAPPHPKTAPHQPTTTTPATARQDSATEEARPSASPAAVPPPQNTASPSAAAAPGQQNAASPQQKPAVTSAAPSPLPPRSASAASSPAPASAGAPPLTVTRWGLGSSLASARQANEAARVPAGHPFYIWMKLRGTGAALNELRTHGSLPVVIHWTPQSTSHLAPPLSIRLSVGRPGLAGLLAGEVQRQGYFIWHTWARKDTLGAGRWTVSLTYPDGRPLPCGAQHAPCRFSFDVG